MLRTKKHPNGNQYLLTEGGIWVRNFTIPVSPWDINKLSSTADYSLFLSNEVNNENHDLSNFDPKKFQFKGAVIVSDGYKFTDKHKLLEQLPKEVAVIAVNRSLVKWKASRNIDFFVVNNPYQECMSLMPNHRYYPRCLVSTKTNSEFVGLYKSRGGYVERYNSTPEPGYSALGKSFCYMDDYRNPICASVNLCHKLGLPRVLLLCCDDSFEGERPASVKVRDNLWMYPQHKTSHSTISGMLNWYKKVRGVKIVDHSSGPIYEDAPYIQEEEIVKFFE